jgi:hypothetical protein
MTQKKDRTGEPARPFNTPDNISNFNDLITDELHRTARQFGRNMGNLYKTNKGSLDAFYRLLATVETSFTGEVRLTFLNSFFDETGANQEGGADEEN